MVNCFSNNITLLAWYYRENQSSRKVIVFEIFLVFLAVLLELIKNPESLFKESKKDYLVLSKEKFQADNKEFEKRDSDGALVQKLLLLAGNHGICAGLNLWNPGTFGIIMSWIHFGFYLGFLFGSRNNTNELIYLGRMGIMICNIILILAGIVGIGDDECLYPVPYKKE